MKKEKPQFTPEEITEFDAEIFYQVTGIKTKD